MGSHFAFVVTVAVTMVLAGCAVDSEPRLPPEGATHDYQLGTAYTPSPGTQVVTRDHTSQPARVGYDICYVNGFQTQPGERESWPADLILMESDGSPVFDPGWPDEAVLDTSDSARRQDIAARLSESIDTCAQKGFDAIEFDNLDSYTRSGGWLDIDDNAALAKLLTSYSHKLGLAVAQKNTAEHAARLRQDVGFDFAVVEECAAFDECGLYTDVYGAAVIGIEYPNSLREPFETVCAHEDRPSSMTLRDRHLVGPNDAEYVFEPCD